MMFGSCRWLLKVAVGCCEAYVNVGGCIGGVFTSIVGKVAWPVVIIGCIGALITEAGDRLLFDELFVGVAFCKNWAIRDKSWVWNSEGRVGAALIGPVNDGEASNTLAIRCLEWTLEQLRRACCWRWLRRRKGLGLTWCGAAHYRGGWP